MKVITGGRDRTSTDFFDTLKVAKERREPGFDERQAEAITNGIRTPGKAGLKGLATKVDLWSVRESPQTLIRTRWRGAMREPEPRMGCYRRMYVRLIRRHARHRDRWQTDP